VRNYLNENFELSSAQVEGIMSRVYRRGDRLIAMFVICHVAVALAQAAVYGTWALTLPVAALAAALFLFSAALAPGSKITRMSAGISLQAFCALHIYQLHGQPEMHFYFFTAQTMMIVYEDWAATWPGTWLIIGQHILFAFLQNAGSTLYFFPESYITIRKLGFHFGIALVQVALCSYWAARQRRSRLHEARQTLEVEESRRQAESAAQSKAAFLANMSHEIRTPMNGVLGMADLLDGSSLGPDQRECVNAIRASGEALLAILNDILDLSKIEAGAMTLHLAPLKPREVIEGVCTLMAPRAAAKKLELAARCEAAVPEEALGDVTRLRQVLLNLVGNALKFTERGHVLVEAYCAGANRICFSVSDTGIGVPRDKQDAIFGRFIQAEDSTTRRFGGTGLGLSISQSLVELMGGKLELESEPDQGSRFFFTAALPALEPGVRSLPLANMRALIVHDTGITSRALGEILAGWGANVDQTVPAADYEDLSRFTFILASRSALGSASPLCASKIPLIELREFAGTQSEEPLCGAVRVTLPARQAAVLAAVRQALDPESHHADPPAAVLPAPSPENRRRILVAEDNAVNQRVASLALERLGYAVEIAGDGSQAVEMWRKGNFAAILMDCQMPGTDGYQATGMIREAERQQDAVRSPIIAMTANAMAGDRERCLREGMDGYVSKPISLDRLREVLEEHLGGSPTCEQQPAAPTA
jgi:signal transduction histidine kinase/CheY-like chemotaxis protein